MSSAIPSKGSFVRAVGAVVFAEVEVAKGKLQFGLLRLPRANKLAVEVEVDQPLVPRRCEVVDRVRILFGTPVTDLVRLGANEQAVVVEADRVAVWADGAARVDVEVEFLRNRGAAVVGGEESTQSGGYAANGHGEGSLFAEALGSGETHDGWCLESQRTGATDRLLCLQPNGNGNVGWGRARDIGIGEAER